MYIYNPQIPIEIISIILTSQPPLKLYIPSTSYSTTLVSPYRSNKTPSKTSTTKYEPHKSHHSSNISIQPFHTRLIGNSHFPNTINYNLPPFPRRRKNRPTTTSLRQ